MKRVTIQITTPDREHKMYAFVQLLSNIIRLFWPESKAEYTIEDA